MRARVVVVGTLSSALQRLSDWDTHQERASHPWWTPRGLFFWWVWRPVAIVVVHAVFFGLTFVLWRTAEGILGMDRNALVFAVATWVVIIFFVFLVKLTRGSKP